MSDQQQDLINHPQHYAKEGITVTYEPIDFCSLFGFVLGNAFKYLFRRKRKGTELQDLQKAAFYLNRAMTDKKHTKKILRTLAKQDLPIIKDFSLQKDFLKNFTVDFDGIRRVLRFTYSELAEIARQGVRMGNAIDTLDREELIKAYLIYKIPRYMAEQLADEEIQHRELFARGHKEIVSDIDQEAVEVNKAIREKKALNQAQIDYKKRAYANAPKKGRQFNHAKSVVDPHGTSFKTTSAMCQAWGVLLPTYCNRLAKGWTMLEALQGKDPVKADKAA